MIREHLGVVLATAERFDPLRRGHVHRRAVASGDLTVRHVPHEQVQERVLGFIADGRATAPLHEALPFERVKRRGEILS